MKHFVLDMPKDYIFHCHSYPFVMKAKSKTYEAHEIFCNNTKLKKLEKAVKC